jgi:RNA polymerase sigma factor (sigma-70 family)
MMNSQVEKMIEENKKLIYSIANSLYIQNKAFSIEDLIQVGFLAICKSANKYDPERGKTSTFITHCAKNDMLKFIRRNKISSDLIYHESKSLSYDETEEILKSDVSDYYNLKNTIEENIVTLKINGESNIAIGKRLNLNSNKVSSILLNIKERLARNNG